MDPVSVVVAAVVAGAAAGLKDQAAVAVKDAYGALKRLLVSRYSVESSIDAVERKPTSEPKQGSLGEDLADTGAADDPEVIDAARKLVEELQRHEPARAEVAGVDLDDVAAQFVRISNVKVRGSAVGVDMDRVKVAGGIVVEGVDVDAGGSPDSP